MPKIIDPDLLVVGTELSLDTTAKTFTLNVAGNLVAKDGVSGQALYSKLIELWETSTYNRFDFPAYVIGDPRAGMFAFGYDGTSYNGWKPGNDATRQMIRDAGWSEYSAAGALNRQYVGVVVGASGAPSGAQFWYQKASGGAAINFTFTDAPNEAIQVFGDAANGNFDTRSHFRVFCHEYNYSRDDTALADIFETATGAYKINMPVAVVEETKITANDAAMSGAPYSGITVTYYATDQSRNIGGSNYNFRVIIDGNGATKEQIYTKIQYLLRQGTDIDSGAGAVIGKTANSLLRFVGDTLYTTQGVFIDDFDANDTNRIVFTDQGGTERVFPAVASGTLAFDASFVGGVYRMYFTSLPGAGNDFGESGAVTVEDADAVAIAGTITSANLSWTFAHGTNSQGGRTPGTDAAVKVFALKKGATKPRYVTATITSASGQTIGIAAETDRGYVNP